MKNNNIVNRIPAIEKRQEEIKKALHSTMSSELFNELATEYNTLDKELHSIKMTSDPEYKAEYEAWQAECEEFEEENKEFFEAMDKRLDDEWSRLVSENPMYSEADNLFADGKFFDAMMLVMGIKEL